MVVFDHHDGASPKQSSTALPYMAPTAPLLDTISPASTALSVVSDAADAARPGANALDGGCSDPDVRNKLTVPAVPTMTAPTADDDEARDTVPVVRITEAPPASPTVASPRVSAQTDPLPHAPSQRASLSAATASTTGASSTRDRRRATMDARASNRLSGFFSQLLTARRNDPAPPVPSSSNRDRSVSPPASPVAQTFTPPPRPTTPPPCLPPPTLAELGLIMSVITPGLTSAQYATPPTNGTFLAPHYLLLCHAQGLDVLPLVGPPAPQPYALVRRVAFKSVIVMEERGVLVAIAGRRDGVRVYALEEVRRAVEWRLDLEVKREAEHTRRSRDLATKGKNRAGAPIPGVNVPASSSAPSALSQPEPEPPIQAPLPPPPSYASTVGHRPLITRVSTTNLAAAADAQGRTRGGSLSSVIGLNSQALGRVGQQKSDWGDVAGSDDEALVAAGPEASAALDERTSAGAQAQAPAAQVASVASPPLQIGGTGRRATVGQEANPGATLSSMRNALAHSRSNGLLPRAPTLQSELVASHQGVSDGISFAEMLRESRLPPPDVVPNQAVRRASVVMLQSQSHPVFTGTELDQVNEDTDHGGQRTESNDTGKKDRDRSRDRVASAGAALNGNGEAGAGVNGDGGPGGGMAAAPKLEYIKLPGTKGALMIKAVETAKKSFLAILCGESGEKVELFAGTYRTALGLSRTFILPDSPKSLELQLQGDDLVEVFLVFAQNVFGLEPATVRVREVRIGRNERRAARRRARAGVGSTSRPAEIEPTVVTTTVSVGGDDPAPSASGTGTGSRRTASLVRRKREVQGRVTHNPNGDTAAAPSSNTPGTSTPTQTDPALAEEMAALNTAQAGPYTTFQQLSFAPAFPLAAIADDYVIPPTYLSFCEYRDEWEPDVERVVAAPREPDDEVRLVVVSRGKEDEESPRASGSGSRRQDSLEDDPAHALQFEPPPPPVVPTVVKWFYLDPKGVVQGGLEATDVGQALLDPADESRTALPNYKVGPGAVSRRSPYVWRLGTSIDSAGRATGSSNGKRRAGAGAGGGRKRGSPKSNGASAVAIQGNDSGDESDVYIAPEEEVIFLAREQDNVYICERSAGKFRLLRLSKTNPTPITD
ncbi:hypothetical protein FRC07_011207 [Ceratobasidium sp. 392]|nr:hypothetical protein FRC07_011207 [Ceratobasidium sp. 392]